MSRPMDTELPTTISASRVPALLGLDKRLSPLTLFLRLRGAIQERDISNDEAVREGRFYERATAEIICDKYKMVIVAGFEQKLLQSGCLSGHPDFVVQDEHGKLAVLEVKNPFWSYAGGENDDDWGEPGTDQVPRAYFIQSLIYQHLLRDAAIDMGEIADYAYVAVKLRGGVERFRVPYDPEIIEVVKREVDMMLTRVQINDPPDPRDEADMRKRWIVDDTRKAEVNLAFVGGVLKQLREVKAQLKDLGARESELKAMILGVLQEAAEAEFIDHQTGERIPVLTAKANREFDAAACWASQRDLLIERGYATVDTARLRVEQKSLYEQFMSTPTEIGSQKRTIRLRDKAIDQILLRLEANQ